MAQLARVLASHLATAGSDAAVPSMAQLAERRTVEAIAGILRSLVRLWLEGDFIW